MSESPLAIEIDFVALLIFSIAAPISTYVYMMRTKAISRSSVLLLAIIMIVFSGIDVFLLQHLSAMSQNSPSRTLGFFFSSEFSIALYLIPLLYAGVGVNMISHILITHLVEAENKFDREHRKPPI